MKKTALSNEQEVEICKLQTLINAPLIPSSPTDDIRMMRQQVSIVRQFKNLNIR